MNLEHPSESTEAHPVEEQRSRSAEDFLLDLAIAAPRLWVTWTILALNVLVYALMLAKGVPALEPTAEDILAWGANLGPLSIGSEPWRLITAVFVHIGALHLALNMWFLLKTGAVVERLYGHAAFLVIYLFAGLTSSLASVAWNSETVSAGASGALFGIAGAFLAFLWRRRAEIPPGVGQALRRSWVVFLLYNLVYGLANPLIDNAAHVGGLAAGVAAGLLVLAPRRVERAVGRRLLVTSVVLASALIAGAFAARARVAHAGFGRAWILLDGAGRLLDEGRWEEAAAACTTAIELEPDWGYARGLRGYAHRGLQEYGRALEDFEAAAEREDPLDPAYTAVIHAVKGEIAFEQEDWKGALEELDLATGEDPMVSVKRGCALLMLREYAKAIAQLDRTVEQNPGWIWPLQARSTARTRLLDHEGARADIQQILAIEPQDALARLYLAQALMSLEDFEEAAREVEQVLSAGSEGCLAHATRGWIRYCRKDFAGALADFEAAREIEPDSAYPYLGRGSLRVLGERNGEAVADFERSIELGDDDEDAYLLLGIVAHLELDLQKALYEYARALIGDPTLAMAHARRGLAHHDLGEWERSENELRRALEIGIEEDEQVQLYLWIDRARLGRRNEADAALARHLEERKPDRRADWFPEVAEFLLGRRQTEPALVGLDWPHAMKQDEARATALFCVGIRAHLAGDDDAARAAFERVVELRSLKSFAHCSAVALLAKLR